MLAQPGWAEGAPTTTVEAALSGCALVVSDRAVEREYFGSHAYYCDPANTASIRSAVVRAFENHAQDAPKRVTLVAQLRAEFSSERAAADTLTGYRAAVAARSGPSRSACIRPDSPAVASAA